MATGSITTLGLGSGLELQSILDQLKEADSAQITAKENQKVTLQKEVDAYNSINAKLFAMKSNALSLSLESDFLKNTVTVTDEEIASATVNDGISASSFSLDVTQKASFNSWQTVGVESASSLIYTEPETGITSPGDIVTTQAETMDILYGAAESQQSITISLDEGLSLAEIADTINTSDANQDEDGDSLVTASVEENDGQYYLRLSAASGGNSADSQISISGFDYVKADTTFSISSADSEDPMYLSIEPGTTYQQTADLINSAPGNSGVTATVIDTGEATDPYRLTLTSDATGENHRISIQNLPMTEVNGADENSLNAHFSVNGISYQRQTNDAISDVVSGATLNLQKIGETSVSIQNNTDTTKETILSLISNFNDLVNDIKGTEETDEETDTADTENENPLSDSYNVTSMLYKIRALMSTAIDTTSAYTSLADIGLEINRDGTMTFDEDLLDQSLAADPDAVTSLFIGDTDTGITGLGDIINDGLTAMVSSSGIVSTEIDATETRMARLDKDILTATEQLDKRYQILTNDFVRLDSYIRQLNAESTYMQSVIDSFNKTTE
ncbi:MAG: flagellar filament capping protein FliD [Desulfobacula sp.]|jgi:flagellar hook-associated protein 2|nr:flagellar filament capping protein FliD [Desulfobacula sp.]